MTRQRSFLAIKPDGVNRNLVGEIISRFERRGFTLVGLKMIQVSRELAAKHYAEHNGKPFFEGLINFITSGPVVAMVWEGNEIVATARKMMGVTKPMESAPGTIRGDFGIDVGRNIIHGSDSVESAQREIALWFNDNELVAWEPVATKWVYEK